MRSIFKSANNVVGQWQIPVPSAVRDVLSSQKGPIPGSFEFHFTRRSFECLNLDVARYHLISKDQINDNKSQGDLRVGVNHFNL